MTATDELRRLLDERGVEWRYHGEKRRTWFDVNEIAWFAMETPTGYLIINSSPLAPEQVVEATLGPCNDSCNCTNGERTDLDAATLGDADATSGRHGGTGMCHNSAPSYLDFLCSECGFVHYHSDTNDTGDGNEWHFCPNCGAEVVDE